MTSRRHGVPHVALALPLFAIVACVSGNGGVVGDGGAPSGDGSSPSTDGSISLGDGSAGDGSQTTTCPPASVAGYIPRWTPPTKPQSVCTQAQLASYGACLDANDSTSAACAPWFGLDASANSGCFACVNDSKQSDPTWGPLVDVGATGSDRQLNVSGCIALLTNDDDATGCASHYQAFQECESAACADACQGDSTAALDACITAADTGGCSSYLSPAACVNEAGATTSACFASGTYGQKFAALAAVFCLEVDD